MTLSADQVRRIIQTYIKNFNARDFDALMSIYAENATVEDPVGTTMVYGKAAIRAFYEQAAAHYSFLQLTGDFRFAADAVSFSFFCYLGSLDDPMIVHITDSFRFDHDGRVIEMRAFWGEANVHRISDFDNIGDQLPLAARVILVVGDDPAAACCARGLAEKGAVIIIAGRATETGPIARSVSEAGGRVFQLPVAAFDIGSLADLPEKAKAIAGRLDGCVNLLPQGKTDAAELTFLCSAEQLRLFAGLPEPSSITNVVRAPPPEPVVRAMGADPDRLARVNYVVTGASRSGGALTGLVIWLASNAAVQIDSQTIALSSPTRSPIQAER